MLYQNLIPYTIYSKSYARFIHKRTYHFIELLKTFPYSFSNFYLNDAFTNLKKYVIDKRFLVIYGVYNNDVEILYFVDGRRSCDNYFLY